MQSQKRAAFGVGWRGDTYQSLTPIPSSDTNAKRKQFEYNGLSELTSVCELTAGTTAFPDAKLGDRRDVPRFSRD